MTPRRAQAFVPQLEILERRDAPAAGILDATFGQGGRVVTDLGDNEVAADAVVQADGRVVVGGTLNGDFVLVRYNADGGRDMTFGTGGRATTDFGGAADRLSALALQPDGKILAAGVFDNGQSGFNQETDFALARYNPDGSPDTSFDGDGKVTTDFNTDPARSQNLDDVNDVTVGPDGRIVVVGSHGGTAARALRPYALARYNADGSLDTSFSGDGKLTDYFRGNPSNDPLVNERLHAVTVLPDGKILAAGDAYLSGIGLVRYNPDGSRDTTLGNGLGAVAAADSPSAFPRDLTVQPDGRIVVAGGDSTVSARGVQILFPEVVRFHPNGRLDVTFGDGGRVESGFGAVASSVTLQPDGRILVAGETRPFSLDPVFPPGDRNFLVTRLLPNGVIDPTYGSSGFVGVDFNGFDDGAVAVALQADGKAVAAGTVRTSAAASDLGVIRLTADDRVADANARYLNQLYLDLFGRLPDAGGLAFWQSLLNAGRARAEVVQGLLGSQEYRSRIVNDLYGQYLGRAAGPGGLTFWVDFLNRGGTVTSVQVAILGSVEYGVLAGNTSSGFLSALYADVLGRPIEPAALTLYTDLLTRRTHADLATILLTSREGRTRLVNGLYNQFLRRNADPAGLEAFVNFLERGSRAEDVALVLVSSEEYVARL